MGARRRASTWNRRLFAAGPAGLDAKQKLLLLEDPLALAALHEAVWSSTLTDQAWKDTRVLPRRAPNVVPLRPRVA